MSMISGLIDKLNKSADEWNASNMFELARMCREAADLREELADAPKCEMCEAMLDCDECLRADGSHKERRRLSAENAKLRELVKRMFDRVNYECHCCSIFCSDWDEDNECCVFTTLMRELGVDE